uniref:Uncharacterized protein n=1 Tax=Cacopsylla melanoneura TaxID=428564 RepID=A0A8D8ZXE6_9HEMI
MRITNYQPPCYSEYSICTWRDSNPDLLITSLTTKSLSNGVIAIKIVNIFNIFSVVHIEVAGHCPYNIQRSLLQSNDNGKFHAIAAPGMEPGTCMLIQCDTH